MSLLAELKRRNVIKVGAAYVVVAWLVVQAASIAFPTFEAPPWALRVFIFVVLLGFPFALVMSWMLQLTPEGVRVEPAAIGNKRVYAIAAILAAIAVAWFFRKEIAPPAADVAAGPRSIAVLPFTSLGADAETSGLAGGLHDTLITQLSRLKGLEVRSRTSVMKYKDWTGGLKAIADELGVAVLLEGSVQRIGNRTVVNAQLIDARTDAHLWAETIDRTGDDLFALQAEIAQRVASELKLALSPEERKVLTVAPTQDREAYALYVQGLRVLNDSDGPMSESAREIQRKKAGALLEAAVARDPAFAGAWASLSNAYATIAWDARSSDYRSYAAKARNAAQKAVTFGAELPEARFARGVVALQLDFDFARAVQELEQAVRDAPGNAGFHSTLAIAYRYGGRWEDSAHSSGKALELDPTDASNAVVQRNALVALRRMREALEVSRRVASLNPGEYSLVRTLPEMEGWIAADLSVLERFVRGSGSAFPVDTGRVIDLWLVGIAGGDHAAALATLDSAPADARPDLFLAMRADALRLQGREADARVAWEAYRDENLALLQADRDPYVEASLRAFLAHALARLGDVEGARANIAKADALWGREREPSDGGRVWFRLLPAHLALGEHDQAFAKVKVLVEQPSYYPAGRMWLEWGAAELHGHEGFRALMREHGVDVEREPFELNRAPPKAD